ncbi:MAG: ATP-dependent zinc metalloprotease FtsH [Ruminococcaceae bacterium]|nr:ATP-dependent zinc metalloprotease FtsH [Oscillospiraceae bacterium]
MFGGKKDNLSYTQIKELFENAQVKSFVVEEQTIYLELHEPSEKYSGKTDLICELANPEFFRMEMQETFDRQSKSGVLKTYAFRPESGFSAFELIWPLLIVGGVLLLLWFFAMSKLSGGGNPAANFGKARTTLGSNDNVTFADVAGADEEKEELREIVDFLRNPGKFKEIGAKIPHGLLLVGPPGTGKTLLARAVAGEAKVQFLSISGSDFVELYVGVGASRVRDLFEQAKKVAPAIVFIDEIDAVGRKRGSGLGGGHDEKEQTLNQLLVEMDGFTRNEGVIVLAATNRPDILDPALLRPGRFDRQIHVGAPDVKGREEILKVHAKGKRLDESVDLRLVARSTVGFTGADLSNLMNEAAIRAACDNRKLLTMEDLNEAMMKIMAGPEKRSRVRQRKDLKETAIHEAGHAIAMYHLPTQDPVLQITIIPRGQSLGATWHVPRDDSFNPTRNQMYEEIVGLLGGRVAEALFLGDISVGASNDIDRATKLARDMVARFGMCEELGTVSYLDGGEVFIGRDYQTTKGYSEKVAATIDDQVKLLVDKAYAQCAQILKDNEDKVMAVTDFLLEHETMTGAQFADCMEGREIGEATKVSLFESHKEDE